MNSRRKPRRDREIQPNPKDKLQDKFIDLTGIKSQKRPRTVRSGLGDLSSNTNSNDVIFMAVPEHKELDSDKEDEYEKYDSMWDSFAYQQIINSGATILHSHIEIPDSPGRNRIIVRRND